jgi:hypothetical protein
MVWPICPACPAERLALLGLWKRSLLGAIMFSRGLWGDPFPPALPPGPSLTCGEQALMRTEGLHGLLLLPLGWQGGWGMRAGLAARPQFVARGVVGVLGADGGLTGPVGTHTLPSWLRAPLAGLPALLLLLLLLGTWGLSCWGPLAGLHPRLLLPGDWPRTCWELMLTPRGFSGFSKGLEPWLVPPPELRMLPPPQAWILSAGVRARGVGLLLM